MAVLRRPNQRRRAPQRATRRRRARHRGAACRPRHSHSRRFETPEKPHGVEAYCHGKSHRKARNSEKYSFGNFTKVSIYPNSSIAERNASNIRQALARPPPCDARCVWENTCTEYSSSSLTTSAVSTTCQVAPCVPNLGLTCAAHAPQFSGAPRGANKISRSPLADLFGSSNFRWLRGVCERHDAPFCSPRLPWQYVFTRGGRK